MKLWPSKHNYYYRLNRNYTFLNNFLTGAIDLIENSIWDLMLACEEFSKVGTDSLSNLIERGYYYKGPFEEKKLFQKLYKNFLKKANDRPIKYVICPTYSCNLRCTYCFEKDLPDNPNKNMSPEMLDNVFDAIKTVSKKISKEIRAVELFGGGCPFASIAISEGKEPVCERFQEVLDTFLKHRGNKIVEKFTGN